MDTILLSGIEVYAYGGVTPAEKETGQRYRIDLEMEIDLRRAGASDAVEDTAHYGEVHAAVVRTIRERPFSLLESVAERIAQRLLTEFPIDGVTVCLAKLLPPIDGVVASAAVRITRRLSSEEPGGFSVLQ